MGKFLICCLAFFLTAPALVEADCESEGEQYRKNLTISVQEQATTGNQAVQSNASQMQIVDRPSTDAIQGQVTSTNGGQIQQVEAMGNQAVTIQEQAVQSNASQVQIVDRPSTDAIQGQVTSTNGGQIQQAETNGSSTVLQTEGLSQTSILNQTVLTTPESSNSNQLQLSNVEGIQQQKIATNEYANALQAEKTTIEEVQVQSENRDGTYFNQIQGTSITNSQSQQVETTGATNLLQLEASTSTSLQAQQASLGINKETAQQQLTDVSNTQLQQVNSSGAFTAEQDQGILVSAEQGQVISGADTQIRGGNAVLTQSQGTSASDSAEVNQLQASNLTTLNSQTLGETNTQVYETQIAGGQIQEVTSNEDNIILDMDQSKQIEVSAFTDSNLKKVSIRLESSMKMVKNSKVFVYINEMINVGNWVKSFSSHFSLGESEQSISQNSKEMEQETDYTIDFKWGVVKVSNVFTAYSSADLIKGSMSSLITAVIRLSDPIEQKVY